MLATLEELIAFDYRQAKIETNETIMLLHGNGFNSTLWGSFADLLNETCNVIRIDLHGEWEGPLSWKMICDEIHKRTERIGVQELHLVGHSFGASLAMSYAGAFPGQVQSLVLISSVLFYPPKEGREVIETYIETIHSHGLNATIQNEIVSHLTLLETDSAPVQAIMKAYSETNVNLYLKLLELQMIDRPFEAAKTIICPVLLLAGEKDSLYLPELQSITTGYFGNATLLIVPNAANALFIDQPELSASWVMDFIRRKMNNTVAFTRRWSISSHLPLSLQSSMHAALTPNVLRVTLIHSFRVSLNGSELKAGWDKRFAKNILAFLIFNPSCTREELCDALFPNLNLVTALNNLRVYLNYLKKLLILPNGTSVLHTTRNAIRLDADIECDLVLFSSTLKELIFTDIQEHTGMARAKELLGTVEGNKFLTGIYDQWFVDLKFRTEEQLATLSSMVAYWEASMNRHDSALYFESLSNQFIQLN
ncbi:alpha/beta fold hydrolase [Paenibacillus lycopersici]|uniref:Alpha/beta fold hydrolase n=1 Tax=Paenibacillus lycopersici TaxID=2704462 RepID=A0A6C0FVD6_9BACL|nr:alpha/beta hydrolase [Paenibacillus lycopersici]QHT59373.1 alpha/beta fold hydrolase [Paenibacillus lycopersici]